MPHTEECRQRIEEAIGADKTDDRAKNVKERFDQDAALQVEEGDARGNIHGKKMSPKGIPRRNSQKKNKRQRTQVPRSTTLDPQEKMNAEDEGLGSDDLADTPVRPAAVKRRSNIHDDEPDTKQIIRDDGDEKMEGEQGLDLDGVRAGQEN